MRASGGHRDQHAVLRDEGARERRLSVGVCIAPSLRRAYLLRQAATASAGGVASATRGSVASTACEGRAPGQRVVRDPPPAETRAARGAGTTNRFYDEPTIDWSLRAVGPHLHPGGEEATVLLAQRAASYGLEGGATVLDLGSGLGAPARFIARRFAASVVSLDAEPSSQSAARLHAAAEGLSARCPQVLGLGEALPFAGGVFDAVWSQDALCHMRKERTLGEVARVVRGGGLFVFSDWLARDRLTAGELRELELRWSFPSLLRLGEYTALLDASGFDLLLAEDVTHLRGPRRSVPEDQGAWEAIFARRHGGDRLTEQEARGRSWVGLLEADRTGYGMFVAKRRAANASGTL